ncbi:MAG: phosphodiester glycosidase family protein, partial [Fimbriimonas ginsengisoli]|nr:phosphodiester glycosidase family protein [Fimbriimonas ginsengisoli]
DDTVTKGRDTVTHMVQRTKAIAGINADFFHVPYTGDPLGLFLKAGRLDSVPTFPRAVLAWGEEGATFALPTWTGKVILPGGAGLPLDGINELATGDRVTLDTPATGFVLASGPNTALLLRSPSASWGAECDADLEISEVVKDLTKRSLGPGEAALVASGSSEAALVRAAVGQRIRIHWQTDGLDWRQYPNAVGGGPFLVRAGKLAIDWKEERFRDALALKRHPRSAVGLTPMGDLVLVAVDGRQAFSDGASLDELAAIVLRLGCVDAMNLDGGGSTCLSLGGLALNRPSDGTERPVADAILVFTEGAKGSGSAPQFALKGPPNIAIGGEGAFSLLRDGKAVPNAVIFWSAAGSAWVDQGGILHPIAVGDANLTAW